ncbi:hypothetical protein H696_05734 [Fonticula alba]|uniref:Transmembrane protein n=1 Tax=Fonticula alba TaxID=691883 RepID=A0A058Z2N6_FONAL|nr:hypothetical protein H696_05734 [Fonticula alba]KCV67792.1 hypothetical protein H696_05734 [Fonticula alba]|eukprot:XP_009497823.1 hypothetical protein H696_05734 [Fonticula alba]
MTTHTPPPGGKPSVLERTSALLAQVVSGSMSEMAGNAIRRLSLAVTLVFILIGTSIFSTTFCAYVFSQLLWLVPLVLLYAGALVLMVGCVGVASTLLAAYRTVSTHGPPDGGLFAELLAELRSINFLSGEIFLLLWPHFINACVTSMRLVVFFANHLLLGVLDSFQCIIRVLTAAVSSLRVPAQPASLPGRR